MAKDIKGKRRSDPLFEQIAEFKPNKADLRRSIILNAVIDCLAEDGIHNLTSLNISARTKMLRSHVNYYFPNQEKMLAAAMQFVVVTGQEITVAFLAAATHPQERLLAHTRATFTWFERYPKHAAVMLLLNYYGAVIPAYRRLNQQIRAAGEARIEAILASGKLKRGVSKKQVAEVARAIRGYLLGVLTHATTSDPPVNYENQCRSAERTVLFLTKEIW